MNTINTNLSAPTSATSLASAGILATVKMTCTTLSESNQSVSDEVTTLKKADKDAVSVIQHLIGKNKLHQAIMSYRATRDNWLANTGYEWGGKWYIIPTAHYPRFMQEFAEHQAEFNRRVEAFLTDYPNILANIAFKQGDLFKRHGYPTVDELRNKFSFTLQTMPVPENDWRVQVSQDQAKDLHNHYERQHMNVMVEIGRAQREKLADYLRRIAKACTIETSPEGKVTRGRLYETTITQALELCDTIAGFNPINDTQLEDARAELANLLRDLSVPALKQSDSLRSATKQNIDSILSKFGR